MEPLCSHLVKSAITNVCGLTAERAVFMSLCQLQKSFKYS